MSNNIIATNRMSATQLMQSQNSNLEFIQNPKNGNLFFVCGNKTGYVSPAVKKIYQSCEASELQYAEVSIDGNPAVPCLMVVGSSQQNVKRTLTL